MGKGNNFDGSTNLHKSLTFFKKGYSRKGYALYKLNQLDEAVEAYNKAIELEPTNDLYKKTLSEIQGSQANAGLNMFGQLFNHPSFFTMLQTDPELKGYLAQPDFLQMVNNIRQNPQMINMYMQDKRLMTVITKLLTQQMGVSKNK